MKKTIIQTDKAPAPIGPYNQAIKIDGLVYTSGQIPLDLATGQIVEGGIKAQTETVLNYVKAILEEAGSSLDKVIKTTVFLQDMAEFPEMNGVYASFFKEDTAPARSTVQVAALPKGVAVEIEVIALA